MVNEEEIADLKRRLAALEKARNHRRLLWISIAVSLPLGLWAATAIPNTFSDGDTLSASKLNANFAALAAAEGAPVGTIVAFAGSTAPTGWLLCDGTQVSRSTYSTLYGVVTNAYGAGDGSTSFHLPDLRGRFLRGLNGGTGRDPNSSSRTAMNTGGNTGDTIGSIQSDAFQGHRHQLHYYSGSAAGSDPGIRSLVVINGNSDAWVREPSDDGTNGVPRTTSETRPVNAYANFIIKY